MIEAIVDGFSLALVLFASFLFVQTIVNRNRQVASGKNFRIYLKTISGYYFETEWDTEKNVNELADKIRKKKLKFIELMDEGKLRNVDLNNIIFFEINKLEAIK